MTKNNKTRLIVYPIVIVIVFLLCRVLWVQYAKEHPEQALEAHKVWMKIQGIEFCETPQEAIQLYAEALIRGDREEALIYIYRPKYEISRWESDKKYLYGKTNEELKKEGKKIINDGRMEKADNYSAEWKVVYNIDGEIVAGPIRIINTGYNGWKID